MKYLSILAAFSLAISSHLLGGAPNNVFNAEVKGVLVRQVLLSANDGRIESEKLDVKRVFKEFLLSSQDYALVLDIGGPGELFFRAKKASAALPDVSVLKFGDGAQAIDTKKAVAQLERNFTSTSTGTLFENLDGRAAGLLTFQGPLEDLTAKKVSVRFTGHGSDEAAGGGALAILKFKLSTTTRFEQAP